MSTKQRLGHGIYTTLYLPIYLLCDTPALRKCQALRPAKELCYVYMHAVSNAVLAQLYLHFMETTMAQSLCP